MTVQSNPPELYRSIRWLFQLEVGLPGTRPVIYALRVAETVPKGHGRIETRRLTASRLWAESSEGPGRAQVFPRERTVHHVARGKRPMHVCRSHESGGGGRVVGAVAVSEPPSLGIENQRHGPRDVRMHEDHTRTTCPALGKMIACLNHRVIGWTARWGWRHLMPARRYLDAHLDEAFRALWVRLV